MYRPVARRVEVVGRLMRIFDAHVVGVWVVLMPEFSEVRGRREESWAKRVSDCWRTEAMVPVWTAQPPVSCSSYGMRW